MKQGLRGLLLLLCFYQSLEASLGVGVELLLLHRPCLDTEKCLFLDTIEKCKPHLQLWPSVACCRTRGGRSPASPPPSSTRPDVVLVLNTYKMMDAILQLLLDGLV